MPATALDDLLSVETLTGLVRRFSDQSDNRSCTHLFTTRARPILPPGISAAWEQIEFSRHMAPISSLDSPHREARRLGRSKKSSVMATIKLYKDLPAPHLFLSRGRGEDTSDAEAVLAAELEDMGNLIANAKEFLACGALLGRIEVNPQTVPGSELSFRVDWQTPKHQASADWGNPKTAIRSKQVRELKRVYKDQSGLRAATLIADAGVEGHLVENEQITKFTAQAVPYQLLQNAPLQGSAPQWEGMGGLSWRFTDGTYKPEGGSVTRYWPEDEAVILPGDARLSQVLGWAEGKVFAPAGSVFAGAESAAGLVQELRGTYAYAELCTNPIGIRVYAGWHGLPVILNPNAVLRLRVRPSSTTP